MSQSKEIIKNLPCLGIQDPEAFVIVETDASENGYGGILNKRKHKMLKKN